MEIGSIIKKARNDARLSQEQAAEMLGVSRQTVSNWENGRTYPDIISVIKMSDLYSVSLDCLLKEETSMKKTYREYLDESTNAVKSNERKSKLIMIFTVLGIWAFSLIAFGLVQSGADRHGYSTVITMAVLPVTFFAASFVIGLRDYYGKLKWLMIPICGVLSSLSGYAASVMTDESVMRIVRWPDFTRLPIGLLVSAVGLIIGCVIRNRKSKSE